MFALPQTWNMWTNFITKTSLPPRISIVCLAKNGDHHSRRAEFVLRAKAVELDFYDYLGFHLIGKGQ